MKREWIGTLLVVLSATSFGMMGIFAKYAYDDGFNVNTLLSFRFLIAASLFWLYILFRKISFQVSLKELVTLSLMGILGYAVMSMLIFSSFQYIPISVAIMCLYMYPTLVTILAYFFENEALSWSKIVALLLSSIGLLCIVGGSFISLHPVGILMTLGADVIYSCYITVSNRMLKKVTPLIGSTYVTTSAGLVLLLISIGLGTIHFQVSYIGWIYVSGVAIVSTVIAFLTFFEGIKRIGPSKASIVSTAEPLVAAVLSAILFGEQMSMIQLLGSGLVIISLFLLNVKMNPKRWTKQTANPLQ